MLTPKLTLLIQNIVLVAKQMIERLETFGTLGNQEVLKKIQIWVEKLVEKVLKVDIKVFWSCLTLLDFVNLFQLRNFVI